MACRILPSPLNASHSAEKSPRHIRHTPRSQVTSRSSSSSGSSPSSSKLRAESNNSISNPISLESPGRLQDVTKPAYRSSTIRANFALPVRRAIATPPISTTLVSSLDEAAVARIAVSALKSWEPQTARPHEKNSMEHRVPSPCRDFPYVTGRAWKQCTTLSAPVPLTLPAKPQPNETSLALFQGRLSNPCRAAPSQGRLARSPPGLQDRPEASSLRVSPTDQETSLRGALPAGAGKNARAAHTKQCPQP